MNNTTAKIEKNNSAGNNENLPHIVVQTFDNYPAQIRATLLEVRALIFQIQQDDPNIGELNETLRWGEVSYLTEQSKSGSMIRLATTRSGEPAVFFHCGTLLIERFRGQYGHVFDFEANRALKLNVPVSETIVELKDCLTQALRYKLDKDQH